MKLPSAYEVDTVFGMAGTSVSRAGNAAIRDAYEPFAGSLVREQRAGCSTGYSQGLVRVGLHRNRHVRVQCGLRSGGSIAEAPCTVATEPGIALPMVT